MTPDTLEILAEIATLTEALVESNTSRFSTA